MRHSASLPGYTAPPPPPPPTPPAIFKVLTMSSETGSLVFNN
jgi:hypothetical protein